MKANASIKNGSYVSVLDDGNEHEVRTDLSKSEGGGETAASALELCVMSFAGCITTLWAIVASKSKVEYSDFYVEMEAEKSKETGTIGTVTAHARVTSEASEEKLQRAFEKAMKICPVGVLFKNAGVDISKKLTIN